MFSEHKPLLGQKDVKRKCMKKVGTLKLQKKYKIDPALCVYVCAGEVAGARGDERDAAERRPQAEAEAPTRQGVLPSRGRKVGHFLDFVAHS